jgi:nitroreductase
VNAPNDEGIAGQTILLSAVEKGMGGCFIGNVDRENLAKALNIPSEYSIKLVIALGYPKEEVVIEEIGANDDIKYYRDENQVHHVPKIRLDDMILDVRY